MIFASFAAILLQATRIDDQFRAVGTRRHSRVLSFSDAFAQCFIALIGELVELDYLGGQLPAAG